MKKQSEEGASHERSLGGRLQRTVLNYAVLFLAWIAISVAVSIWVPSFLTWQSFELISRQTAIVALAAIGMTFVIMSGGIDLSIGSIVALITVVIAWVLREGHAPAIALSIGLVAGLVCGFTNGLVVTQLKVSPFIVTLGSLLIFRGIAKGLANEQKIDAPITWIGNLVATLPNEWQWMILPPGLWLLAIGAVGASLLLGYTRFGRHVVAVGSNPAAAFYSAVAVARVRLIVFVLAGAFAGLAGIIQFSRLTVGDPTVAVGLELDVIAAVVIGGASLSGGTGTILGSILGAFIMSTIRAGGSQLGLPNWIQEIVTGLIIVLAVALDRWRTHGQEGTIP